jgi:hypothetical protein
MPRVRRIGEIRIVELLDQECDALEAVAAVRVAGMGQEAHQRLVELDPLGRFRAIRGHRALGALRRDRAGAVGEQQTDEGLEREQVRGLRLEPEERDVGHLGERALREDFFLGNSAEPAALVALGGTDAPINAPKRRIHHGRLSAVSREIRLRASGPHASVVATAASTPSAVG